MLLPKIQYNAHEHIQLENVAIANALQLETARRRASHSGLLLANFVLCMRTNCYFAASDQNSGIAIRFSDPIS